MNIGIKKSVCILSAIILSLSLSGVKAADNNIVDIKFIENGNQVNAVIYMEKGYSIPIKPVKAGDYYNIILPNIGKGSKSNYSPNTNNIDFVRVTTLSSTTDNGSYTKIAIKAKPGVTITASSQVYEDKTIELDRSHRPVIEQPLTPEQYVKKEEIREEEDFEEEFHEEAAEEEFEEEIKPQTVRQQQPLPEASAVQTSPAPERTSPSVPSRHTSEILYILIGTMSVLLVIVLLYIKGKDKMQELCGDMNINIDDNTKKQKKDPPKKDKKKTKQVKQDPASKKTVNNYNNVSNKNIPVPPAQITNTEETEEEQTVIDLDEIYSSSTSQSEPLQVNSLPQEPTVIETPSSSQIIQEEDDDIDDFLESFVDNDDEQEEYIETDKQPEEKQVENENIDSIETVDVYDENPIDNLINDVVTTQNMSFTASDIDMLQTKLQSGDLSTELITQTINTSKQNYEVPILTLEDFDKQYPLISEEEIEKIINNHNIKFNDIDIDVMFSPITSYEISEDTILDAQLRKEKEDEANIQYYENEKDFAFTLIKTQDVQNSDELVVLDNNIYPDLTNVDFSNDAIFKEFSFVKPDILDTPINEDSPSEKDIDLAIAREMEIINQQALEESQATEKQDDSILSEFTLIQPDVNTVKGDDQFSTTIFSSMDDIEAQFKALGVEFNSDNKQEEQTEPQSIEEPQTENNTEKQDDSILSEFTLIQPDVNTVKGNDQFSTTVFSSTDDIEAQFKALGVEFNSDNNQEEQTIQNSTEEPQNENNTETEIAPQIQTSIKTENADETNYNPDDTEIYASCQIDFSTELYIASFNNKISLIGMKNGTIKHLYDFDPDHIPSRISTRKTEETENSDIRYLVRADKEKFVVDVSNDDIKLVLVL